MNNVSWLIYLSDISGHIGVLMFLAGTIVLCIAAAYFIASCCMFEAINEYSEAENLKPELKAASDMRRWCPFMAVLALFFWIMAALCPSQETVLAIAASEFGEQLLHTHTANLAEQALDAWLQRQIKPPVAAPAQ